jgi:uncharacterized membrane protein YidH (DUF202 family)
MPTEQRESRNPHADMSFWWALLSNRGQRGGVAIAAILLRQAVPLIGVLLLHWSAQKFLLLAVINFGWNWALLGVWNIATSALIEARRSGRPAPAKSWVVMAVVGIVVLCVVSASFGFPVYYMSPVPPAFDAFWWTGLAMTLVTPLPSFVDMVRQGAAAELSDEQIEAFAKQRRLLLIVSIVPIVGAYELIVNFPYPITIQGVAIAYVLFSTLCELRPDLAAEFGRELPR